MSRWHELKKNGFFKELTKEIQKKYFWCTQNKILPAIDNLYYSVFIRGDGKEHITIDNIKPLLDGLEEKKQEANEIHEAIDFSHGLMLTLKSYKFYAYCLTQTDLYDIFLCYTLPNIETPRIVVQLRALGLWTRGVDNILIESYLKVVELLAAYNLKIEKCRENRIDYCYHINGIANPGKIFKENAQGVVKNLHTNLSDTVTHARNKHLDEGTLLMKDYICVGSAKSNNVRARVYDKVKEVIEQGYKAFFFEIWKEKGLISYYDKWCFEYVFPYQNVDYLAKARLAFYVEHGTDPERREEYEKALNNLNKSLADYKCLADEFMPPTTPVLNIEYETKRKFYYYSDEFIETCPINWTRKGVIPKELERIYKIIDNKYLYLNTYLTKHTLSFYSGKDADGEPKYLAWWERLRNTKLDGLKTDEKLLREYTFHMDKKAVQKRAINAVASQAVYEDNVETDFMEDISDFLADITDNQAHRMIMVGKDGEVLEKFDGKMLARYQTIKDKKERLLKNRKKKRVQKLNNEQREKK